MVNTVRVRRLLGGEGQYALLDDRLRGLGKHAALARASAITVRQLQCLEWVQEGKSASDIGCILGLSGRTVEKHLVKLCGHLGVKTRIQAVVRARELGLLGRAEA